MELQTENGKKKVPLSTGLKWLRLVCMAVVFGIIAGGVMVGMNYLGGSMAAEEESIPQTSTVKVTAKAEDSDAVVAVAREAMPSVVTISTMSVEEMRSFFGGTQEIQVQGAGTGVIVNKNESELLIATNNHVVEGASQLSVGFVDQSSVEAQVKGTDVDNDLAVVAVQLSDIPAETLSQLKIATIGDSDELELGQPVVAIGNALGYGQSVTTGVVSALNRGPVPHRRERHGYHFHRAHPDGRRHQPRQLRRRPAEHGRGAHRHQRGQDLLLRQRAARWTTSASPSPSTRQRTA